MKKWKNMLIIFLVFVLVLTSISAFTMSLHNNYQRKNYFTFQDISFTKEEYSVFYMLYVNEFINEYAMYLSYWGLDVNKDFATQQFDETHTWEEAFKIESEKELKQFVVLNEDLKETHTKVNVDDEVDALIKIFKNNAQYANMEYEQYLQNIFGENVTEKDVKMAVEYKYKAIEYSNVLYNKFMDEINEKELVSLYSKYPATFDKITFREVTFGSDSNQKAKEFLGQITTEDSFIELAKNYTDEDTLKVDVGTQNLDQDDIISWLYDDSRKLGDTTNIEVEDGNHVLFFKSRKLCDDKTANFSHIYFNTIGANNEEMSEIRAKADAVYSNIINSEDKVKAFNDNVLIYSDDSVTKMKNGKIENVRQDEINGKINDWLFDTSRKENDITLIEDNAGIYILKFEGFGEVYWKIFARQYLANQKYDEYLNNLMGEDIEELSTTESLENITK